MNQNILNEAERFLKVRNDREKDQLKIREAALLRREKEFLKDIDRQRTLTRKLELTVVFETIALLWALGYIAVGLL
jgi:hypothetical protein